MIHSSRCWAVACERSLIPAQSTRTVSQERPTGCTALDIHGWVGRMGSVERRSTTPARVAMPGRRAAMMLVVVVVMMTMVRRRSRVASRWVRCCAVADARLDLLGPDCSARCATPAYNDWPIHGITPLSTICSDVKYRENLLAWEFHWNCHQNFHWYLIEIQESTNTVRSHSNLT